MSATSADHETEHVVEDTSAPARPEPEPRRGAVPTHAAGVDATDALPQPARVSGSPASAPLRVAAIYPAFAPGINEMAMVWEQLASAGRISMRLIAGGNDKLKGLGHAQRDEAFPNLVIRRVGNLVPQRGVPSDPVSDEDVAWAAEFRPDVIFISMAFELDVARRIAARCGAPIVLHLEFWFDNRWLNRSEYLLRPLRRFAGNLKRARLLRRADHVIASHPAEQARIARTGGRVSYLPWPHPVPADTVGMPRTARNANRVVCIGSQAWWKGARNLQRYGCELLREQAQAELLVVGPLLDATAREAVAALKQAGGERVTHLTHLPRKDALAAIGSSLCVLLPSDIRGWGAVGDAWNTRTPVIGVDDFYELQDEQNALIVRRPEGIGAAFARLRDDAALWERLGTNGMSLIRREHTVDTVAERLMDRITRIAAKTK